MAEEPGKFNMKTVTGGNVEWELVTPLGQVMAKSGAPLDRESAERVIDWIRVNAKDCPHFMKKPPGRPLVG